MVSFAIYIKKKTDIGNSKLLPRLFICLRKDNHLFSFMLLLQAYLAYGIPQNSMKRGSLLVKVSLVTLVFLLEEALLSLWIMDFIHFLSNPFGYFRPHIMWEAEL